MILKPIFAIILCVSLVSPSAAQIRSAAAGVSKVPFSAALVPSLGGASSSPSLMPSASLGLTPSLSLTPSLLPNNALVVAAPQSVVVKSVVVQSVAVNAVAVQPQALAGMRSVAPARSDESPYVDAVAVRAEGANFFDGSDAKGSIDDSVPVSASPAPKRSSMLLRGAAVLAPASAAASLSIPAWASTLVPYVEGAALIGGAYALTRGVRWILDKIAVKRSWEKNTIATWRFVSSLAVWGGAAALGLSLAGISGTVLAETFGVGGAAMALAISLAVKDVAGNLFHGVHFLLSRPYTIGDKITVGKTTAVVRDLTLRYVVLTGEDGRDVLRTHASLAAAAVTLYGTYQTKALRLKLRKPALPHGLFRALRDAAAPTLWKPIVFSAASIAALAFFPLLGGLAAAKSLTWVALALPYIKAGLVAFLASSIANTLSRSIGRLGERYSWNPAVVTVAKLGTTVATWIVGGSFLLNAVGVSWIWVMKTLSLGGALASIAVIDYGTAIFNAIVVFKLKPFSIGDENISIGEHTGTVVDITWQNVVLKLDEDRYIIIPHSVVKDAEIKNPKKYGQRAEP